MDFLFVYECTKTKQSNMTKIHPSHFFENIEKYLKTHQGQVAVDDLKSEVIRNGCPGDMVDSVINGAIADEVNIKVTSKNNTMTIQKDGEVFAPMEAYNPTYEGLINDMVSRFDGLGQDRAKSIVDSLLRNQELSVYSDELIYRTKVRIPWQPLSL